MYSPIPRVVTVFRLQTLFVTFVFQGLPVTNTHNVRSAHLTFQIPYGGILHGLAGYFEAVLYEEVCLSIHPERMESISPNMLSWFPMYFPFRVCHAQIPSSISSNRHLKEPLYLPDDSELDVSIWRLTNRQKVWYEWTAEAFLNTPASHRPGPRISTPHESPNRTSPSTNPPWCEGIDRTGEDEGTCIVRVKIGQTSLHNAGGRSSWVGL